MLAGDVTAPHIEPAAELWAAAAAERERETEARRSKVHTVMKFSL